MEEAEVEATAAVAEALLGSPLLDAAVHTAIPVILAVAGLAVAAVDRAVVVQAVEAAVVEATENNTNNHEQQHQLGSRRRKWR